MNMTLALESATNAKDWEKFLLTHRQEALFQSWQWGDVQEKSGHRILRFLLKEEKELVGISQVFVVKARRGPFLHVRHGPVWDTPTLVRWRNFLALMGDVARKEGAWFIRISPLLPNTDETKTTFSQLKLVRAPIHEVDAERCWALDLHPSEEELLIGMRKTTRYEIKLAQKSDVTVTKSTDPKDLAHFFKLYEETSRRHGFVGHTAITEEFEVFAKEGRALLLLGHHEKSLIASAIILFRGSEAIYHHGASISSKIPVSYLVQWEAIREAKKRGMKVYNFYGIAPENKPNHPWRGITLFKKGFGGREINYIHAHDFPLSPLYAIPYLIEAVRTVKRGY